MPYDMPLAAQNTLSRVHVAHCLKSRTARPLANEVAPSRGADARPIEPMLLVYQERAETFRLIAAALRLGLKVLARSLVGPAD